MGKNDEIILSPKHGVNPTLLRCFICGSHIGGALLGKLKDDAEAPKEIYNDICDECQKVIDKGGRFILEVKDGSSKEEPYRTGRLVAVAEQFTKRVADEMKLDKINFMEESVFSKLFDSHFNKKDDEKE